MNASTRAKLIKTTNFLDDCLITIRIYTSRVKARLKNKSQFRTESNNLQTD